MTSPHIHQLEAPKTLVSWKEIASFLNRSERTVKRWESERGLPVHRVPGGERGGVFAYSFELESWLIGEQGKIALSAGAEAATAERTPPEAASPLPTLRGQAVSQGELPIDPSLPQPAGAPRWLAWVAGPAVLLGLAAAATVTFGHYADRNPAKATAVREDSGPQHHVPTPRAERLYLQGRYQWSLRTADRLNKSIDDYTRAIVEDPAYAPAYAGLAESYDLLPEFAGIDRGEAFSRAKAAADRAIQLDPNLAAGHRAKAFALFFSDWDVPASDAEFRRALALDPNAVETHHWYAGSLFSRLEGARAMAEIDEALRLSPTTPAIIADAAFIHATFRNRREANIKILRDLTRTQPNLVKPSRYLAKFDLDDENYPAYLADLRRAATISRNPDEVALADAAARGWHSAGKAGMLEGILQVEHAAFARGTGSGNSLGKVYLRMGRPKEALPYFKAALDRNDFTVMTISGCTCVSGLRGDADYVSLFREIHERMHPSPLSQVNLAATAKAETSPAFAGKRK